MQGTVECYFIFDRSSYRTGLNAIKNVAPYNGITLNFCCLQLDGGPIRTSTICFNNSGLDPQHPYVIVKARTPRLRPLYIEWNCRLVYFVPGPPWLPALRRLYPILYLPCYGQAHTVCVTASFHSS